MHTDVGCATNTTCAGTIPCAAIVLDGPRVQTLDPLPTLSCSEFSGAQTYVSAASTDHSPRCAAAKIALSRTALPPPVSFLTPADCAVAPTHPPNRNYLFLCLAGTTFAPQRPLVLSATELDPSHPTLTGTESTKVPVEPSVAGPLRQRLRRVAVPPVCRLQPTPGAGCSALGVRNPFEPTPGGEKSPCCPGSTTPSLHSEDANADESVAPSRKRGHNSGSAIRLSAITCVRYPDTAGRILPRSRHKVIKSFRYCLSIFTIKS